MPLTKPRAVAVAVPPLVQSEDVEPIAELLRRPLPHQPVA